MTINKIDNINIETIKLREDIVHNQQYKHRYHELCEGLIQNTKNTLNSEEVIKQKRNLNLYYKIGYWFYKIITFLLLIVMIYSVNIAVNVLHFKDSPVFSAKEFDKKLNKEKNFVKTTFIIDVSSKKYDKYPKTIGTFFNMMENQQWIDGREFKGLILVQWILLLPIYILIIVFQKKMYSFSYILSNFIFWCVITGIPLIFPKGMASFSLFIYSSIIYFISLLTYYITELFLGKIIKKWQNNKNESYNKYIENNDMLFYTKLIDDNQEKLNEETSLIIKQSIMDLRNSVIIKYNDICNLNNKLIDTYNELAYNYDNKLYKKLYMTEMTILYLVDNLDLEISSYYSKLELLNLKINELSKIETIPNNRHNHQLSEFYEIYIFVDAIHGYINNNMETDVNYQLLKSQLNIEDIKRQEKEIITKEMERQSSLASYQAELLEKQIKIDQDTLSSQQRTESIVNVKLQEGLIEQNRQKQVINKLENDISKLKKDH